MKRTAFFLLILLAGTYSVLAQNTVNSIRARYAEVKRGIALIEDEESGWPPVYYQVNVVQNLPGTGPHHEDTRMYYDECEAQEDEVYPPHYLSFVTCKYNFAVRNFYEEYLYDADGTPAFIYARNPDIVFGLDYDFRFYFNRGAMIKVVVKCRPVEDARLDVLVEEGIWNPAVSLDDDGFHQVYSGTSLPNEYTEIFEILLHRAALNQQLFKAVDESTHL